MDYVIINNSKTSISLIKKLKPNFYVKGLDYKNNNKDITGEIKNEIRAIKSVGEKLYILMNFGCSSKLINSYFNYLNLDQKNFIKKLKNSPNFSNYFENLKIKCPCYRRNNNWSLFFLWHTRKSGKDPILAIKENYNQNT